MRKSDTRAPTRKGAKRFVPVVVVGSDAELREHVATSLSRLLDGTVESLEIEQLHRRPIAGIGAVVLAVRSGSELVAALQSVLSVVRAIDRSAPVVVAGDSFEPDEVIAAFHNGANDVLLLGDSATGISEQVKRWIGRRSARNVASLFGEGGRLPRFLGESAAILQSVNLVQRVAPSDATVLILGESGTGKELVARAIHQLSPRQKGPFIAINCAAIPETLLENELFGHEKGAYTGASSSAIGKVEAAEKGTLFLDEIGEMPVSLQAKILRLLQEKTYDRIGGARPKSANIRIIAATNRNLKDEAEAGRFREDLFYRLSVVPITLPSLRDRPEDIPLLANEILNRLSEKFSRPGLSLSEEAMMRLVAHRWPGNVRELENELERATVLARHDEIGSADLDLKVRVEDSDRSAIARFIPLDRDLESTGRIASERAQRLRVSIAMEESEGDLAAAAESLGIDVPNLRALLGETAESG